MEAAEREMVACRPCGGGPGQTEVTKHVERVFPTFVGVGRITMSCWWTWTRCPHLRGGGPLQGRHAYSICCVFPTLVGVGQRSVPGSSTWSRFPHASGGEPRVVLRDFSRKSFPHMRGGEPEVALYSSLVLLLLTKRM